MQWRALPDSLHCHPPRARALGCIHTGLCFSLYLRTHAACGSALLCPALALTSGLHVQAPSSFLLGLSSRGQSLTHTLLLSGFLKFFAYSCRSPRPCRDGSPPFMVPGSSAVLHRLPSLHCGQLFHYAFPRYPLNPAFHGDPLPSLLGLLVWQGREGEGGRGSCKHFAAIQDMPVLGCPWS